MLPGGTVFGLQAISLDGVRMSQHVRWMSTHKSPWVDEHSKWPGCWLLRKMACLRASVLRVACSRGHAAALMLLCCSGTSAKAWM